MFKSYNLVDNYIVIVWKYTETCNMNCSYCNIDNSAKIKDDNTNNLLKRKLISEIKKNPNIEFYIDIEGGEPTLDKTVYELDSLASYNNVKLKLFTNFFKPDINKLIKFSINNKIELSCNIDESNINNFKENLIKVNNNNIEVSILITNSSSPTVTQGFIDFLNENKIKFTLNIAEDFTNIYNTELIGDIGKLTEKYIKANRMFYNYKGVKCNSRLIHINCNSTKYSKCDMNNNREFLTFKAQDLMSEYSICNNSICGVHDYQLDFRKNL